MTMRAILASVLVLSALNTGSTCRKDGEPDTAGAPGSPTGEAAGTSHGFPVAPGLTPACGQVVLSQTGDEILWDMFSSTESPSSLAAWYQQQLGADGLEEADGEWTWRLPVGQAVPDRVLSIGSPAGPHPECAELAEDAAAIATFSEMHQGQAP